MKKVAIITITRNANFGNVLQNIAMQDVLKKLNCSPETIINKTESDLFNQTTCTLKNRLKQLINYRGFADNQKRNRVFMDCCQKYINYSSAYYNDGFFHGEFDYDYYIAGSDQIWNPYFGLATDFELLKFVPKHKKASYSASFGVSEIDSIDKEKRRDIVLSLSDFTDISVREQSGKRIIEKYTDVPVNVNVDPTMLLNGHEWEQYCEKPNFKVPEKFILVYMLGNITSEYMHKIVYLSKHHNAKIINIMNGKYKFLNPLQFIWMIKHSECVCTDSFHASVFSILFHRQFYIFERQDQYADQSSRFNSLLDICGIDAQLVNSEIYKEKIDWEMVDKKVTEKKNEGIEYLRSHLNNKFQPVSSIEILRKSDCCGCSACAQVCPKNCINMTSDMEGFLYPVVDHKKCVDCGICKNICPIINFTPKSETVLSSYAGYVNDDSVRIESSSGGLFTPLAEYILEKNGVIFGAALDDKQYVHHIAVDSIDNLGKLRGSKYVQSEIGHIYIDTKKILDEGRLVLFTGTACQISGLKHFLRKDYSNLFTVDVLCHGTPSPKLWQKYLEDQTNNFGASIRQTYFRRKNFGWKRYAVELKFSNATAYLKEFRDDSFMKLFLGNICLRPSCHDCKFKALERDSDLTIGDAWGIDKIMPELDDDKGTSVILVHTEKGHILLNSITEKLVIKQGNVDELLPPSADSRKSVIVHPKRSKFFSELNNGKSCNELLYLTDQYNGFLSKTKKSIKNKLKRLIKRR